MVARKTKERIGEIYAQTVFSRGELLDAGWRPRAITDAVRTGALQRLRRDRYAASTLPSDVARAVRSGGRLCCLSLLRLLGVFVMSCDAVHVQLAPNTSRVPIAREDGIRRHWVRCDEPAPRHVVALTDALAQAVRCQSLRAALATLDSAAHLGVVSMHQMELVFRQLPARFGVLRRLMDPSAESGPETCMRLILRSLGLRFETQVRIPGVGRVDFLVEGWLIIECDSREFHEGWEKQQEDRRRDIAAAKLGFITVRPLAADILWHHDRVHADIQEVVSALRTRGGSVHNSGDRRSFRA